MLSWLAHGCSASGRYHDWPTDALWEWMESDLDVIMVGTWMLCGESGLGWLVDAGFSPPSARLAGVYRAPFRWQAQYFQSLTIKFVGRRSTSQPFV